MQFTGFTIESRPDFRRPIRRALAFERFAVAASRSGADGLLQAWTQKPLLILLDMMMSGMNHPQVCSALAKPSSPIELLKVVEHRAGRAPAPA